MYISDTHALLPLRPQLHRREASSVHPASDSVFKWWSVPHAYVPPLSTQKSVHYVFRSEADRTQVCACAWAWARATACGVCVWVGSLTNRIVSRLFLSGSKEHVCRMH